MKEEIDLSSVNLRPFFNFVLKRQQIYHKRNILNEPHPWTTDPILSVSKSCNVYRELDRGTKVISEILSRDVSPKIKLFNIIAYRFFNKSDFFSDLLQNELLDPDNFDVIKYINHFKGKNVFNSAYLIISCSPYPIDKGDKCSQVLQTLDAYKHKMDDYITKMRTPLSEGESPNKYPEVLQDVKMVGSFLSGQMFLDCTYSRDKNGDRDLTLISDNDFLIVGPGSNPGICILYGLKGWEEDVYEACRYTHSVQDKWFKIMAEETGIDWFEINWKNEKYSNYPYLSLHDIQNSFCEFRKYHNISNGQGRRRYFKYTGV